MNLRKLIDDSLIDESEHLSEVKMDNIYYKNNIIIEKVDCFKQFINRLIHHIYETYFGPEDIFEEEDIEGHFRWCFNKTLSEFKDIGIDFSTNDKLYDYFYEHFYIYLYQNEDANRVIDEKLFTTILDYKKSKKPIELDELIKLYRLFNLSFSMKNREIKENYDNIT